MIKVIVPCRVVVTQTNGRITASRKLEVGTGFSDTNSNPTLSSSLLEISRYLGSIVVPCSIHMYLTRARFE
jgi:uncharacterized protein (DUF302 family)